MPDKGMTSRDTMDDLLLVVMLVEGQGGEWCWNRLPRPVHSWPQLDTSGHRGHRCNTHRLRWHPRSGRCIDDYGSRQEGWMEVPGSSRQGL